MLARVFVALFLLVLLALSWRFAQLQHNELSPGTRPRSSKGASKIAADAIANKPVETQKTGDSNQGWIALGEAFNESQENDATQIVPFDAGHPEVASKATTTKPAEPSSTSAKHFARDSEEAAGIADVTSAVTTYPNVSNEIKPRHHHGVPKSIKFLRIQKTASTSFGDLIMGPECRRLGQRCDHESHLDWNLAAPSSGKIVTFLRDPVERFLSEFYFIGSNKWVFRASSWDFRLLPGRPLQRLWEAARDRDLWRFIETPQNFAINRQTLYLAGYKRPKEHTSIANSYTVDMINGINWNIDGPKLLHVAMQHLNSSVLTFGIVDEFICSVKLIARDLGWSVGARLKKIPRSREQQKGQGEKWSAHIDDKLKQRIESANAIDLKLFRYAEQLFAMRRSGIC